MSYNFAFLFLSAVPFSSFFVLLSHLLRTRRSSCQSFSLFNNPTFTTINKMQFSLVALFAVLATGVVAIPAPLFLRQDACDIASASKFISSPGHLFIYYLPPFRLCPRPRAVRRLVWERCRATRRRYEPFISTSDLCIYLPHRPRLRRRLPHRRRQGRG